jgi:hypothetical protein
MRQRTPNTFETFFIEPPQIVTLTR